LAPRQGGPAACAMSSGGPSYIVSFGSGFRRPPVPGSLGCPARRDATSRAGLTLAPDQGAILAASQNSTAAWDARSSQAARLWQRRQSAGPNAALATLLFLSDRPNKKARRNHDGAALGAFGLRVARFLRG